MRLRTSARRVGERRRESSRGVAWERERERERRRDTKTKTKTKTKTTLRTSRGRRLHASQVESGGKERENEAKVLRVDIKPALESYVTKTSNEKDGASFRRLLAKETLARKKIKKPTGKPNLERQHSDSPSLHHFSLFFFPKHMRNDVTDSLDSSSSLLSSRFFSYFDVCVCVA